MPPPEEITHIGISPLIARGLEAFRRELPELLNQKKLYRHWVAYHDKTRLGIARSEAELYQECFRLGLQRGEFVVKCIIPEIPAGVDVTPSLDV